MSTEDWLRQVCALEEGVKPYSRASDIPAVEVPMARFLSFMRKLRSDPAFEFDFLFTHMAVDRPNDGVFELLYQLHSYSNNLKLVVAVTTPRNEPVMPTVGGIWAIAEFQEREVHDLFGVLYDNHPDLRRLFLEDEWTGFPLRKDYQDGFMLAPDAEVSS